MAGTVVAVGPEYAGFEAGDRAGGVVFEDANAELVLADPCLVSHVPAKADAAAALALVRGGLIALSALRRTELWDLLAAGRLNPKYIDLPLGEITKAIDLVATRSNLGRVVLRTR